MQQRRWYLKRHVLLCVIVNDEVQIGSTMQWSILCVVWPWSFVSPTREGEEKFHSFDTISPLVFLVAVCNYSIHSVSDCRCHHTFFFCVCEVFWEQVIPMASIIIVLGCLCDCNVCHDVQELSFHALKQTDKLAVLSSFFNKTGLLYVGRDAGLCSGVECKHGVLLEDRLYT